MTKLYTTIAAHNSPLVSRLRAQMIRKGLNPKTLAEKAKVGRSFVYDILSGRSCNPTSGKIALIAQALDVNVQYLLTGINANSNEANSIASISKICVEPTMSGNIVVSMRDSEARQLFTEDWLLEQFNSSSESLRSLVVSCDSMYPTLKKDDFILIDTRKRSVNPPALFLIFDGIALKPRRLEMISPERVLVTSDNDKYASYECDFCELNIIGKIVWYSRKL